MHWGGVAAGVLIGLVVMLAVWRLVRKLEGDKPRQPRNRQVHKKS